MKTIIFLILGIFLTIVGTISQANADPYPGLRVIVIDTEAGGFGESLVRSINPNLESDNVIPINNAGTLQDGENIATFGGDVYVANVDRITKLNLDSEGVPDPSLTTGDNNEDITNDDFVALTGIVIDPSGLAYVSDSFDNKIYTVDLNTDTPAGNMQLSIDADFAFIRDMALEGDNLYVLDADFSGDDGRIFKIDLTASATPDGLPALEIYSGDLGVFSLADTRNIAVHAGFVYVSGNFDSMPGIIKIDPTSGTAIMFSDNTGGQLSIPNGLAIDPEGKDLYVADDNNNESDAPTIYRFSLLGALPKIPIFVTNHLLSAPAGLAILTVEESTLQTNLLITKQVDNLTPLPNEHIFFTIKVTNQGPDIAEDLIVTDNFPTFPPGTVNPFIENDQLSYTIEFYDASTNLTTTGEGTCEFLITNHVVTCQGFDPLDVDDAVIIRIEGVVDPGAQGTLTNTVTVTNEIFFDIASVDITVNPTVEFSILKSASFLGSVTAGESTIDYTITITNSNTLGIDALNVVVVDSLPSGVTIDQGTVPEECKVINADSSSQLECNYGSINNGNSVTIEYTVDVNSDAPNPLVNTVTVECDNCVPDQSDSTETPVSRLSELSIQKMADKTEVIAGQDSVLYAILVTNDGPSDAENVRITDTLPAGVTLASSGTSAECDQYDEQTNILTCTIPTLPFDETAEITINVNVNSNAAGTLENTASVTSNSEETNPNDNSASSDPIEVLQLADVTITKSGPETTVAGRIITYEFTVSNIGSSDAEEVLVSDELPEGFTLIPSTELGSLTDPMCQDQAGTVECQFGTVEAGQTLTKSIQVKIALTATGNIENSAGVTTITEESDSDNNLSTIITIVEPPFCGRAETDFDNVITGTPGNDHIKGTNDDDLIFGLGGNDKIHGKNGNDCIIGGDGDDKIWGGKGDDGIEGNAGNDQLHGQQGNDTIIGGDGNDKIFGGQDNDAIDAGAGDDKIHANQGNDTIVGGDGNDWIGAGIGNDTVNAGAGNDKIYGRPGNDILNGEAGDDYIHGGQGDDTVNGGDGKDKIFGHQGHDTLNGDNGNDYIHGGQGNDSIDGGADTDRCSGAQGNNTITNCEIEDKKMKEENEENDDDEGESESEDDDNHGNGNNNNKGKNK